MADAIVAVRGCASADVDPEIARVVIGIRARDKDRLAAIEALAKADAAVWAVLSDYTRAVQRSRSDGVRVLGEPERAPKAGKAAKGGKAGKQKSGESTRATPAAGHTALVCYEITVGDFAVLDEMLSALADQPGVELSGPSWGLRADSPVYRALRAEAVADARARAEQFAAAAGATLTGIIELSDQASSPPCEDGIVHFSAGPAGEDARASWVIQPARQSASVVIEARFSMSQPYFP